ncbi:MAG: histidine phosphatase family protein [Nocardioidaceae bacterium]
MTGDDRVVSLLVVLLHLVRHGASAPDPATPADAWPLRDSAREGIEQLRDSRALPPRARWFSSPEIKALETARLLHNHAVQVIDDLREAERSAFWFEEPSEFEATVERAFTEQEAVVVQGWEPLAHTRSRVAAAARPLLHAAAAGDASDVVMVGHGTAWTLLVAELTHTEPDIVSWRLMGMPDHCALDVDAGRLISTWGAWRTQ